MAITLLQTGQELEHLRSNEPDLKVVDVRLKDDFEAAALPGATSACVYQVSFLDDVAGQVPGKEIPVVVYGQSAESHESRMAAEKLERAGYTRIYELRSGIEEIQGPSAPPAAPAQPDGNFALDLSESRVEWTGRNLLNKHWGKIGLKSGNLTFASGQLAGGEVVLDMKAITCDDLSGSELHDVLIAHLESHDFFDVEHFPEARVAICSSEATGPGTPGSDNLAVRAELTMKGVTRPVDFEATAGVTPDGAAFAAQASFSIDRTEWKVIYGSGKFFQRLSGHVVNDRIDLQLRIVAPLG